VFTLSGLVGDNDVSRANRGDGTNKFEKHWRRLLANIDLIAFIPTHSHVCAWNSRSTLVNIRLTAMRAH